MNIGGATSAMNLEMTAWVLYCRLFGNRRILHLICLYEFLKTINIIYTNDLYKIIFPRIFY